MRRRMAARLFLQLFNRDCGWRVIMPDANANKNGSG
jgi:hypothetical protein